MIATVDELVEMNPADAIRQIQPHINEALSNIVAIEKALSALSTIDIDAYYTLWLKATGLEHNLNHLSSELDSIVVNWAISQMNKG